LTRIAIIIGSTRPGRNGEAVAQWVYDRAAPREDATFEVVDLAKQDLPELHIADVRDQVTLSLFTDFEDMRVFRPASHNEETLYRLLDQVVAWSDALAPLRAKADVV